MAKKKTAEETVEGTEKKPAKKAAPKKAAAKKPAGGKKPPRGKKKEEPAAEVEAAAETAPELADVIEAEIIAETPVADMTIETEAVEPIIEEAAPLSEEEQELSAI